MTILLNLVNLKKTEAMDIAVHASMTQVYVEMDGHWRWMASYPYLLTGNQSYLFTLVYLHMVIS